MATYKAIFFDLDGTLLPMDQDEFLKGYFTQLGAFFAKEGFENPKAMVGEVINGTKAMMAHHPGTTNEDAFWSYFEKATGQAKSEFEPLMNRFYEGPYNLVGEGMETFRHALDAVSKLAEKGYEMHLITMPLFPPIAVRNRLKWCGLDVTSFGHVTTYDNSHYVKPMLDYYRENLEALGLEGSEVLMVGNNATEDMAALELGCDGYLITDMLLNSDGVDIEQFRHGSFEDFLAFVDTLETKVPACPFPSCS